jgi:hypothetical protein
MFIPDPDFFPILDPGPRGEKSQNPGSATVVSTFRVPVKVQLNIAGR